ncbi:MAG TPA: ABC transporter substrate-binding protein [Actinophytocola sp.]|uniref:ABC transporter substrate-binding protein n=1 Tax=Actinophytocola sp. TaxID=1872138 RepID=UPI002DDD7AE6|nr:ABC transporter substrate-binding protein [Actinophytocola sp.]HEV2780401.1 ABC transporter substrate-binding protein [Actinophytocola sp.]
MSAKRALLATAAAFACLTATACVTTTNAATSPGGGAASGYPVTISNCGKDYTFNTAPSRVVVMNGGSVAEVSSMLALGLGDRIIANAQSYGASDVPGRVDEIAKLPTGGVKLNDMMDIPREAMIGLRPDFVISTYDGGFRPEAGFATRDDLRAVGANSYAPASSCLGVGKVSGTPSIADSYQLLRDLGKIFGVGDRAERLIAESERRIATMTAKVKDLPKQKVMLIIPGMAMGGEFSSVGGNGIWNDIFAKAGAENAFAGVTDDIFANLSREQVAAADVDALLVVNFMSQDPDADARKLLDQFPQWDAARTKRYVVLSDSIYFGPSNDVAVERLARAVHPEAF